MKRISLSIAAVLTPVLLGWSDARAQTPVIPQLATHELAKQVVLSRAQAEIAKLGIKLPDEMMMKGLERLGFKAEVSASGDRWKVAHPLGHPWAISWVHLEMDSRGKVLRHGFQPGE